MILREIFKWVARVTVLLAGCMTMQHVINEDLEYRMDLNAMLVISLVAIAVVRVWMPWERPSRSSD